MSDKDIIYRQDAIDAINAYLGLSAVSRTIQNMTSIQEILENLPSAQPETPPYIAEIESEYKKWVSMPPINKPLAKALYEVWKKHVREDVSRNG